MRKNIKLSLLLVSAIAVASVVVAFSVSAATGTTSPKWYIGGTEMKEGTTEKYGGAAEPANLTFLGTTTKCEHLYYLASIENAGGQGKASVSALENYECSISGASKCKIEGTPKDLNQPYAGETVFASNGKQYLVVKGVKIEAKYTGTGCLLAGTKTIKGSVGGLLENSTQTVVFNKASEEATGAKLESAEQKVEFSATFNAEDVGANHRGELVEAK